MKAPAVHLEALRRYPFDTVLTPCNYRLWIEDEYRRDLEALEEEIQAQDAGLMFIKALARNLWRRGEHPFDTWYEPLDEQPAIDAAVAFALSRPDRDRDRDRRRRPSRADDDRGGTRAASRVGRRSRRCTLPRPGDGIPFVRVPGREIPDWLEDERATPDPRAYRTVSSKGRPSAS